MDNTHLVGAELVVPFAMNHGLSVVPFAMNMGCHWLPLLRTQGCQRFPGVKPRVG